MIEFIFLFPIVTGLAALMLPTNIGRIVLLLTAFLHLQLTIMSWLGKLTPALPDFFSASPEGLLVLLVTSFIFLCISLYSFPYMNETAIQHKPVYICCMLPLRLHIPIWTKPPRWMVRATFCL